MFSIFLILLLAVLHPLIAKPTCDADSIVSNICTHLSENSEHSHIKTSDGGLLPNPFYKPKVTAATQTTFQNGGLPNYEDFINADLAFQVDAEIILKNSNAKNWSGKSMKMATSSQNLGALLTLAFPDDSSLKDYKSMPIYFPQSLSDSDSSVIKLNDPQIIKVLNELGPETLGKLRDRFSTLPKMTILGGGIGEITTAESGPLFQRIRKSTIEEDQSRQMELFRQAKSSIIEMIKNGRSDVHLTSEQKNLIGRVTSVGLITADSKVAKDLPDCRKQMPQAFFLPQGHKVVLCENLLDLPDATLLRILAHEIGHSIDPCTASCDHMSANQEKIEKHLDEIKSSSSETEDSEEANEKSELTEEEVYLAAIEGLAEYEDRPFIIYNSLDTKMKDKMIKEGFIKLNHKGIPRAQQPFNSIRSCLIRDAGLDNVSPQDVAIAVHQWKDAQKRFGKKVTKKEISEYETYLQKNRDCVVVGNKMSQMSEAMADVYAAYAVSSYLKQNPPKTLNDRFALEGLFARSICDSDYNSKVAEALKNGGIGILEQRHPLPEARTKSILLQFPGVATHFDPSPIWLTHSFANV